MRYQAVNLRTRRVLIAIFPVALYAVLACPHLKAAPPTADILGQDYAVTVQPLLAQYCHHCHGDGDSVEAELNLAALNTWDQANRNSKVWQQVKEMLEGGLMPPEDSDQPTPDELTKLQHWINDYLSLVAGTEAGDPGPVRLRPTQQR